MASSDGRNAVQITSLKRQKTYGPSFSPDGRIVAFHSASEKGEAVWVVSASGGPARQITPDTMACAAPAWSKRSGEVYFSCRHDGKVNIWRSRLDSAQPVRVEGANGVEPAISDDGRWLYFIRRGDLIGWN